MQVMHSFALNSCSVTEAAGRVEGFPTQIIDEKSWILSQLSLFLTIGLPGYWGWVRCGFFYGGKRAGGFEVLKRFVGVGLRQSGVVQGLPLLD